MGFWLTLLLLCTSARATGGVQASLDRDHVMLDDTVTLTLQFSDRASVAAPDLTSLRKDFQILERASGSSHSLVNGSLVGVYFSSITLRPLHVGTIHIPALPVGSQHTVPLTLHVADAPTQGQGKPAFLEVALSTHTPYVGEQVRLEVRLYYTAALIDGSLNPPNVDNVQIRQLGYNQRYQSQRNGVMYRVLEKHYALIAQRAGSLQLQPIMFRGRMLRKSAMGNFFNQASVVNAHSKVLQLTVKPRPKAFGKGAWLPARQIELNLSGLPASGQLQVQVGEPLTVTVHEGATGLAAENLPTPTFPDLPGADVYPSRTQDVTRNNGQWITGSRSRNFAIVPNRPGTLHLPPLTLRWWNVVTDREQTARIPAHTLTVVASSIISAASTHSPAAAGALKQTAPARSLSVAASKLPAVAAADTLATPSGYGESFWRWLALGSALLWVLSVLLVVAGGYWMHRRRRRAEHAGNASKQQRFVRVRGLRNAFMTAAHGGELPSIAHALLAWAQAERSQIRHLQDLIEQLDDPSQVGVIEALQRGRYARDGSVCDVSGDVADAFRQGLAWRGDPARESIAMLPPLYP